MTTNTRLLKADAALVRNQSPVTVGTIFKGWRGTKGIDYIVTGINTAAKEIYAVKHNAINEDGTVHAAVTRHKRTLKYTETPSGAFGLVHGMTSILGQKADINAVALDSFNKSVDSRVSITGFKDIGLFAQPTVDRRSTGVWS